MLQARCGKLGEACSHVDMSRRYVVKTMFVDGCGLLFGMPIEDVFGMSSMVSTPMVSQARCATANLGWLFKH